MNMEELKNYLREYRQEYGEPVILKSSQNKYPNASNTSDRKAWKGISWIDYWRALTERHSNTLQCSRCGKKLFVDIKSEECLNEVKRINEENSLYKDITADSLKAEGGHIFIETEKDDKYYNGYYITPLCKEHNSSDCNNQIIRADSLMCAEIGSH